MKTHSGQEIVSKDAAAAMKAPFTADVEEMKTKFVQLAAVFADNKMAWRPSDRVRSVAEVLLLMSLQVMDSCGKLSGLEETASNRSHPARH